MNRILIIFINLFFVFTHVVAQQKSFYPEGTKNNNSSSKNKEVENNKDEYQYKSFYYSAIKEKSLENFDKAVKYFEKCIKLNPLESAPYYEIAQIYIKTQPSEGVKYAKKAYEFDSDNKWYALFYAENLFLNKDYYNSIKVYKSLISKDKDQEDYYLELAKIHLYDNNFKAAISTYNNLEKIKGLNHYTSVQKHKIYSELKDFKKAAKEITLLLVEFPYDVDLYEMLSDCYILDGDLDKAFDVLKTLSNLNPNSASVHFTLSDFYLQKGDLVQYEEELKLAFDSDYIDAQQKIRKFTTILTPIYDNDFTQFNFALYLCEILYKHHSDDDMVNYIYADLLKVDQQLERSVFHYKNVVRINPNQKDAWEELLFSLLSLNNLDTLVLYSESALELYPTNPIFYYLNSLAYYYTDNYLKSIESVLIGVNFIVNNTNLSSEMYAILGNSYNAISDFKNSDESYEKALEFSPNNVQVLNNYAYYLSLRVDNLERAKQMSAKTIEMFPDEANYYDTYAWILYKMKDYKEAKIWMQKALDISESQTFYDHMADILTELGELEEAELYRVIQSKDEDNE